ncbi:MAG TPA: hypothetical protein VD768_01070 [Sphingomicrobium sp.]|nr:hypothetical protein [Sphingomicrobium sp.]
MRTSNSLKVGLALCLAWTMPAAAAPTPVPVGSTLARIDKLQPGARHYVRYFQMKDGSVELVDFQAKTISFEGDRIRITQSWRGPKGSRSLNSLIERGTMRPITHRRDSESAGKVLREGFRFGQDSVIALGEADDTNRDFRIATPEPTFNFEIDLEMLQALPWREGAEFSLNLYHPGATAPPAAHVFKVAGSETLTLAGVPVECWVVTTDYNRPEVPLSRFWIAKQSQVVVRVHNPAPDGRAVIKALLPSAP